jgi:ADP-ribose pyrophosphatase YjhB (NUDIX family)
MSKPMPAEHVVVSVIVVDAARRVLLLPTETAGGAGWALPTGAAGAAEQPFCAAQRIVEGATGQTVTALTGPLTDPGGEDERGDGDDGPVVVFFLSRAESLRVRRGLQTSNANRWQWWSLDELPATLRGPSRLSLLEMVKRHS